MKAKKKNISNLSDIEAKRLTSAFMDGNTTLEQESELYRYYSSANIAPELEEFRDMMLWYSNGLKSHSPDNLPVQKSGKRLLRSLIRIMTPIAAAIAVVAAFYMNRTQVEDTMADDIYAQYDGCYIIRNGEKITDKETIMPTILKSEEYCMMLEKKATPVIPTPDEILFEAISSQYNDPAIIEYVSKNVFY